MDSPVMRSLPHNLEAEQSVLGSMIIDKTAIAQVTEVLKTDDFIETLIKSYLQE